MPLGTLEVLLVDAKGLDNNDFLADMDPYVLLTLRTQEKKSNVVSGQGSAPEWNETFVFTVSDDVSELHLKIMEKDNFSADDFVGEATKTTVHLGNMVVPRRATVDGNNHLSRRSRANLDRKNHLTRNDLVIYSVVYDVHLAAWCWLEKRGGASVMWEVSFWCAFVCLNLFDGLSRIMYYLVFDCFCICFTS